MRVGEPVGPDTLEEAPERRGVGYIGELRLTRTAGRHATEGDGCRRLQPVSPNRQVPKKLPSFRLAVVVKYPPLHGDLVDGHVIEVITDDGEDSDVIQVRATVATHGQYEALVTCVVMWP